MGWRWGDGDPGRWGDGAMEMKMLPHFVQ